MYDGYYRRGGSVFGAFLLGGLVGAVIGLLFAPRSGKETRDLIVDKAGDYWGEAGELYETGKEKATEVYSTGREKVTEIASTTKETAAEKGEELRAKIDEARERLQEQVAKSAETAKSKLDEVTPAAKEVVDKAAEGTKSGLDVAATKAAEGLDFVAKKIGGEPNEDEAAAAVAEVKAAVDDAVAATSRKKGDNPLPSL